jgi:hypothetical protein
VKPKCECGCGRPAAHLHHVVSRQECRRRKGSLSDPRNLMQLHWDCHLAHHGRSRVIPITKLRDETLEFAFELMGPAAYYYVGRQYGYDDPRLESLLERAER